MSNPVPTPVMALSASAADVSVFNLADIVYRVSCCAGRGRHARRKDVIYLPLRVRRSDPSDFEG